MAIASLNKFTVPLSTDQSASAQGLLMPKMKYRFRAVFENFGVSTDRVELTKQVSEITRPTAVFNEQTIDVYNSKVFFVGMKGVQLAKVTPFFFCPKLIFFPYFVLAFFIHKSNYEGLDFHSFKSTFIVKHCSTVVLNKLKF